MGLEGHWEMESEGKEQRRKKLVQILDIQAVCAILLGGWYAASASAFLSGCGLCLYSAVSQTGCFLVKYASLFYF